MVFVDVKPRGLVAGAMLRNNTLFSSLSCAHTTYTV